MPVIGFNDTLNIRLRSDELKKIKKAVNKNRDLFYNNSHFVRASVIIFLRQFDDKGNKINNKNKKS